MEQLVRHSFQLIILFLVIENCLIKVKLVGSLTKMEELVETELVLIDIFNKHIKKFEDHLMVLQNNLVRYKNAHNLAGSDISTHISNPIISFLLIKRLTLDLKELEDFISNDVSKECLENSANYRRILKFPTYENINSVTVGLMQLQATYNIEMTSIERVELNGIRYRNLILTRKCEIDCQQPYLNDRHYQLAMDQNQIKNNNSFPLFENKNLKSALELPNILRTRQTRDRIALNKAYYENEIDMMNNIKISYSSETQENMREISKTIYYKMWCGNSNPRPDCELAKLYCRYVTNKSPFLKIAPLKLEEVHLNPDIVIYHEIIYDTEIEIITKLVKPSFKQSATFNNKIDDLNDNVVETVWLKDEHRCVRNIGLRIEDMTGLSIETSEPLYAMNYSVGGNFNLQSDDESDVFDRFEVKNRIATVLLYLNDVSIGGATVFPILNTVLWPKRGTAALWMNLHKSGEKNNLMLHGDCPVLMGNKLAAKKWLHLRGQEWNRPCGLRNDRM